MPRRAGLRLKLNLVIPPLVVGTMAVFVWLDYRHETATIMAAHGMHEESAEAGRPIGLVPSNLSPRAVGRRALQIHALHAAVTIVLVMLGVNAALVERLGAAAAELQCLPDEAAQRAAETVASAAARIVATSRGLDRVFDRKCHNACPKTDTSGAVHAKA